MHSDPRDSPLGRVTGVAYWYLVVTLLQALVAAPGLIALMLVDRAPSNAPLAGLCLLPLGPALAAALYSLHARQEAIELNPARSFWRGYRLNAFEALRLWSPAMLVLVVVALGLTNLEAAGLPASYGAVLIVVALLVVIWSLHALVIASLFRFRTRDTARLAAHYLGRLPLVSLGAAALLVLAAAVVAATFDVVLAMLGGLWAGLLLINARRLVADVMEHFVARPRPDGAAR
jgi:hypothetical protein